MAHRLRRRPVRPRDLIARCLLLAALLPACGGAADPGVPAPAAQPATLALSAAPPVLPGRYQASHAQLTNGAATPWAQETAEVLGLDLRALAASIGAGSTSPGGMPVILTSPAHRTGTWTYTLSDTARVYQLLPVRSTAPPGEWIAVLAAAGAPAEQISEVFPASWVLALVGRAGGPAATVKLDARIRHEMPGLWDVIATSLGVKGGALEVVVEYSHSGGGGACEQRFTFLVRAVSGPRLVVERRDAHEEPCAVLGTAR